jgi:hypothetical protein
VLAAKNFPYHLADLTTAREEASQGETPPVLYWLIMAFRGAWSRRDVVTDETYNE